MDGVRAGREPEWLPLGGGAVAGGWIELRYAASFLAPPVRPVLRVRRAGTDDERIVLPAPVAGCGIWRGHVPKGASLAIDPGPGVPPEGFRVEAVAALTLGTRLALGLRTPAAVALGLAHRLAGRRESARRRLAPVLNEAPLEDYEGWRAARRRAPEPEGLDRLAPGLADGPPIVFRGTAPDDPAWGATHESLARQSSSAWRFGAADAAGALATVDLEPGDRLAPEAVAALVAACAAEPRPRLVAFDADEPAPGGGRRPLFAWPCAPGHWPHRALAGGPGPDAYLPRVLLHRARPLAARPPAAAPAAPEVWPAVDIVIPTRNRADLLDRCLASVLERTAYERLKVIVADNDSDEPAARQALARAARDPRVAVTPAPGPFNYAAICNRAAALGSGEVIVFLNNDVETLTPDWLTVLVREAMSPGTGAVGAKLLYPDDGVQHAGVVLGLNGAAGHLYRGAPAEARGLGDALLRRRAVAAVTGACLAVRRSLFEAAGGFDADAFAVEFNDIDLCLRLAAAGHGAVWTPDALLSHRESASRGRPGPGGGRHGDQRARFLTRWGDFAVNDPFFHPAFSLASESPRLA